MKGIGIRRPRSRARHFAGAQRAAVAAAVSLVVLGAGASPVGGAPIAGGSPVVGAMAAAAGAPSATFTTQPLGARAGDPGTVGRPGVAWDVQPVVSLGDDVDPAGVYRVDLQVDPSSPGTGGPGRLACSGGTSRDVVGGVAAFSGCRIDEPGERYRLLAVVTGASKGGVPLPSLSTSSLSFDIRPSGPAPIATSISFTTQPLGAGIGGARPSARVGWAWAVQPVVAVLDARGMVVTSDNTTIVALAIAPGTPQAGRPGALSCASGATLRVRNGVARFAGCAIDAPGTAFQLAATTSTSDSMPPQTALSLAFDVVGGAAPARVRFTTQPLGASRTSVPEGVSGTPWAVQPVVSVVDAAGRVVGDDYTTLVTLAIDGSAVGARAELRCASGPVVRAVAGVATFDGCQVVGAGDGYVLRANAQTPAAAILHDLSDPFDIGPDPSRLGLAASPDLVGADGTLTLTATLEGPGAGDAPIVFQRRIEGDADWTPVGTSTTSAVGIASFALRPRHSAWYRAVFVGSGSLAAATSAPDRVGVRAAIALAPGSATVAKGTTIAYTARVTPVPPSSTTVHFVVFRLVGGEWRTFAQRSVPMTAAGVATVSWRWSVAGRWRVAVVAPATAWYEQGMSRLVAVTVR